MNKDSTPRKRIDALAAVEFAGRDAADFLQGQLSVNTVALQPLQWRRAVYCQRQGRVVVSGILCRLPAETAEESRFIFLVSADLAESCRQALGRYVLRAKVRIRVLDAGIDYYHYDEDALPLSGGSLSLGDGAAVVNEGGRPHLAIRLANDDSPPDAPDDWRRSEILRGMSWVNARTTEIFLPQFINFEILGGVDFDKGCFVGQEVIARLHHLGAVKRRAMIVRIEDAAVADGDAIKTEKDESAGDIINSAPAGESGSIALASIVQSRLAAPLFVNGKALTVAPPPYEIPVKDKFVFQGGRDRDS